MEVVMLCRSLTAPSLVTDFQIKRSSIRKGMVMVSPRLEPKACWEFEGEILVLHHPTTISVRYQAMGELSPFEQFSGLFALCVCVCVCVLIIIMYIYSAFNDALSPHTICINLKTSQDTT